MIPGNAHAVGTTTLRASETFRESAAFKDAVRAYGKPMDASGEMLVVHQNRSQRIERMPEGATACATSGDAGEADGVPYLVLEYLPGGSLAEAVALQVARAELEARLAKERDAALAGLDTAKRDHDDALARATRKWDAVRCAHDDELSELQSAAAAREPWGSAAPAAAQATFVQ